MSSIQTVTREERLYAALRDNGYRNLDRLHLAKEDLESRGPYAYIERATDKAYVGHWDRYYATITEDQWFQGPFVESADPRYDGLPHRLLDLMRRIDSELKWRIARAERGIAISEKHLRHPESRPS